MTLHPIFSILGELCKSICSTTQFSHYRNSELATLIGATTPVWYGQTTEFVVPNVYWLTSKVSNNDMSPRTSYSKDTTVLVLDHYVAWWNIHNVLNLPSKKPVIHFPGLSGGSLPGFPRDMSSPTWTVLLIESARTFTIAFWRSNFLIIPAKISYNNKCPWSNITTCKDKVECICWGQLCSFVDKLTARPNTTRLEVMSKSRKNNTSSESEAIFAILQ